MTLDAGGRGFNPARRGRLFRKYTIVFVSLVAGLLLASGFVETYFSFRQNQDAWLRLERAEARPAAASIRQSLASAEMQLESTTESSDSGGRTLRAQAQHQRWLTVIPGATQLSFLDSTGKEQLRISSSEPDVIGSGVDHSRDTAFLVASSNRVYYGPVYLLTAAPSGPETDTLIKPMPEERGVVDPYMTVAVSRFGGAAGVLVAEVNLKHARSLISGIKIGQTGHAYVVDSRGQLVTFEVGPGWKSLLGAGGVGSRMAVPVTDLSSLPQVHAAVSDARKGGSSDVTIARNARGQLVLTAYEAIAPPGWFVFVEQPVDEAYAPFYGSILGTTVLLLVGMALAVLASMFFARRMVTPIEALQAAAARIGAGALDQRIDVRTGDELETLADEFNKMAVQLRESYGGLEAKVAERTRDLAKKSRELEVASRHKSEFLANMSHELRTPLNAIIGFSEVLIERMFGALNAKQDEYLHDILSSGRHLLSLINDILDLSKVEAGRMDLQLSAFSLREALENGLAMIRERASRQGLAVDSDIDPNVELIVADERKVKQVLFNLLSNAVKFTPSGGRVKLTARMLSDEARIAVTDTGIGIAPEEQQQIFEEFHQSNRARAQEGTGLGLTLAKKFVELHRGRLWVESDVGVGSTFTFTIPSARAPVSSYSDLEPVRTGAVSDSSGTVGRVAP